MQLVLNQNFREIPYLFIVKIDVLTPSQHLSLQPNFPFPMGMGKIACSPSPVYLYNVDLSCFFLPKILMLSLKGAVIIYGWGGRCKSENRAHSKFAPPRQPRTQNLPPPLTAVHWNFAPPLRHVNHVYIFQGMMLVSGHCNHESCICKSWKCKVGMKYEGFILKYIRRGSGGENF